MVKGPYEVVVEARNVARYLLITRRILGFICDQRSAPLRIVRKPRSTSAISYHTGRKPKVERNAAKRLSDYEHMSMAGEKHIKS